MVDHSRLCLYDHMAERSDLFQAEVIQDEGFANHFFNLGSNY